MGRRAGFKILSLILVQSSLEHLWNTQTEILEGSWIWIWVLRRELEETDLRRYFPRRVGKMRKREVREMIYFPHPLWKVREHPQMNRKREWEENWACEGDPERIVGEEENGEDHRSQGRLEEQGEWARGISSTMLQRKILSIFVIILWY